MYGKIHSTMLVPISFILLPFLRKAFNNEHNLICLQILLCIDELIFVSTWIDIFRFTFFNLYGIAIGYFPLIRLFSCIYYTPDFVKHSLTSFTNTVFS